MIHDSAAAPVFAAMIALINNHRFNLGKPPMGFLNPWIYQLGSIGFTEYVYNPAKISD
jgi:tripeptidyl-peptidase-1